MDHTENTSDNNVEIKNAFEPNLPIEEQKIVPDVLMSVPIDIPKDDQPNTEINKDIPCVEYKREYHSEHENISDVEDDRPIDKRNIVSESAIANTDEPDETPPKKVKNVQDEYIIALRTRYLTDRMKSENFMHGDVTHDVIYKYICLHQTLEKSFDDKFADNSYYDEYKRIFDDEYERHLQILRDAHSIYELKKCDLFFKNLVESIRHDIQFIKIQQDWKNYSDYRQNTDYETYIEYINDRIAGYVHKENISVRGAQYINDNITNVFKTIENECHVIIKQNVDYVKKYKHYVEEFTNSLEDCITNIIVTSFSDEQDEMWNDLNETVRHTYNYYAMIQIPYNSHDNIDETPPLKLREMYENEIRNVYENKWVSSLERIKVIKNREYLADIIVKNENKINIKNPTDTKMTFSNLECINQVNELFVSKRELEYLRNVISKCRTEVFYIGKIYMAVIKGRELQIYENNIMTSYSKQLQLENGIYQRENLPQMLVANERMVSKLFEKIDVDGYNLYILSPQNLVMFSKFAELINGLRHKNDIESYFECDINDLIHVVSK